MSLDSSSFDTSSELPHYNLHFSYTCLFMPYLPSKSRVRLISKSKSFVLFTGERFRQRNRGMERHTIFSSYDSTVLMKCSMGDGEW